MKDAIIQHLSQDSRMASVIRFTTVTWNNRQGAVYDDLIRSILSQQLSVRAAHAIHRRFLDLFPDRRPQPAAVTHTSLEQLREVGLSRQKARYVKNVARYFSELGLDQDWSQCSDEEIIQQLTQIKGVGRWTVEMILMFTLGRPDVLPLDDLGIRQAMTRLYEVDETGRQLKPQLREIAEAWRPYRSFACFYLWNWRRSLVFGSE